MILTDMYVPLTRIPSENSRLEFALNSNVSENRTASVFRNDVGDDQESLLHGSVTICDDPLPELNNGQITKIRKWIFFNAVLVVQVPSEGISELIHRESFKSCFEKLCVRMFTK
jgi:hypothetical protein